MATKIHRYIWSIVCGTALGLGGCYGSDPSPPEDAQADSPSDAYDAADEEEEGPTPTEYGAPMYGPEP